MIDAADVGKIGRKGVNAGAHGALCGGRINGMRRQPHLAEEGGTRVLEICEGDPIAVSLEGRGLAVVHAE